MVVKIRLARFGKRHSPFYNIVVMRDRTARNAKPIEVIGTYDPIPKPPADGIGKPFKDITLDISRTKYWLGVGAQPTDVMRRLLKMFGAFDPKKNRSSRGVHQAPTFQATPSKGATQAARTSGMTRQDLMLKGVDKLRLLDQMRKEPEAFKTELKGSIERMVERWRIDKGVEIPPQWNLKRKGEKAGEAKA